MSYTVLASLAVSLAVVVDLAVLRTRLLQSSGFWLAYGIMLFSQLLVNGTLTGLSIVRYEPAAILGVRVVFAPVEDLAFGFALLTLTLTVWVRLTAVGGRAREGR